VRYKGTQIWRDEISDERFRNIYAEMCIRRMIECKNIGQWQKTGTHIIRYKDEWDRMVRKNQNEVEIHSDG
jgi:hypothetical protein